MKLIAKDVILTQLGNEVKNDAVCEEYISSLLSLLNEVEEYED